VHNISGNIKKAKIIKNFMTSHSSKKNIIPSSGITKIILNEKEKNPDDLKPIIPALSDLNILIQKSGYLFSSSISDNCLCLGLLPYFIDGQRTHHYEIDLPMTGKCVLFGFINSNETLALLFKPDKDTYNGGFLPGIADVFRDNYVRLARFLIENGFSGHFSLDLGTKNLLEETKLFTATPATLKELALKPAPFEINSEVL
jgi:hypothetical protein